MEHAESNPRLSGMTDCPRCHNLEAVESTRRSLAFEVLEMSGALDRAWAALELATQAYHDDHADARTELAAGLVDLAAAQHKLRRSIVQLEHRVSELADATASGV